MDRRILNRVGSCSGQCRCRGETWSKFVYPTLLKINVLKQTKVSMSNGTEPHCSFQRLNVCYNNILRRLLRRPRYCSASGLFAECGIPNGKAVIRNLIYKFITRLNESTNDVILTILSSDIRWTSRIRHYWVKTLYLHHDLV